MSNRRRTCLRWLFWCGSLAFLAWHQIASVSTSLQVTGEYYYNKYHHFHPQFGTATTEPLEMESTAATNTSTARPARPILPKSLEFLHIPKTAGSSIEKAAASAGINWGSCHFRHSLADEMGCQPPDWQSKVKVKDEILRIAERHYSPWHAPIQFLQFQQNFSNPYKDKDVFTVVRNPYERMLSSYYDKWVGYDGKDHNDPARMNEFVQSFAMNASTRLDAPSALPQYRYVYHGDVKMVRHVLRFENLTAEFASLMADYGLDETVRLPANKFNEGSDKRLTVANFTRETRLLIEREYAEDFRCFGYDMIEPLSLRVA